MDGLVAMIVTVPFREQKGKPFSRFPTREFRRIERRNLGDRADARMTLYAMSPSRSFKTVESIGRTLADVEVTTTWGQPTLKVRGSSSARIGS